MIKVLRAGLFSTIQDKGRFGYRNQGVPVNGVMDAISAGFANALLNNDLNDAVLEITLNGPKLLFNAKATIVITGAEMSPKINNKSIFNYKIYTLKEEDILSFGKLTKGLRSYIAVDGGFKTETVLKSKSFYKGITSKASIETNDILQINYSPKKLDSQISSIKNSVQFYETDYLEVFKGPDFELYSKQEQKQLISTSYTISKDNNRMGYQLKEVSIKHTKSILTSPVLPGTVQLTPAGKLIILMKDGQTTGGYPRVLQLTEKSIAILAQKKTNDSIHFKLV